MTALKKYQKLESPGLWRNSPEAQSRDVIVNFGEASLVLSDPRSEMVLSHWSLPAVERRNPGEMPAIYSPGDDATETLELDDDEMIKALATVRGALSHASPRPGRVRGNILLGALALVLGAGMIYVPGTLVEHTASVVPAATRDEIGEMALADLARVTGAPCTTPNGQVALAKLANRIFGPNAPTLLVLHDGTAKSLHLPGPVIALHYSLIDKNDSGDVAAGYALAEAERITEEDPMIPLLRYAGVGATFGLLTTGALNPEAIAGYGEVMLTQTPRKPDQQGLVARFAQANLPAAPYAYDLDPSGETVLPLIEADSLVKDPPRPVLPDGDWIALQGICSD